MSTRTATWLAWALCVLSLVLTVLGTFFLVVSMSRPDVPVLFLQWIEKALLTVAFSPAIAVVVIAVFSTVGALIASRRPDHPIGWLFCAIGFVGGMRFLSYGYAAYAFMARPGSLPAGEILTWVASWLWVPDIGLFVFLSFLSPTVGCRILAGVPSRGEPPWRSRWGASGLLSLPDRSEGSIP